MKESSASSPLPTLGAAVKSIRREQGLSLAAASKLTGFSVATLSKVENGKRSLTYDKLLQLAKTLNVDISLLFSGGAPVNRMIVAGRRSIQGLNEGFVIEAGVYTYTYLAQDLMRKRFTPSLMDLHARSLDEFDGLLQHDGEEHALVLEGEVMLHTEIYAPLHLKKGESVYFDSSIGHAYLNAGPGPARIHCISSIADPPRDAADLPVAKRAPRTAHAAEIATAASRTVRSSSKLKTLTPRR